MFRKPMNSSVRMLQSLRSFSVSRPSSTQIDNLDAEKHAPQLNASYNQKRVYSTAELAKKAGNSQDFFALIQENLKQKDFERALLEANDKTEEAFKPYSFLIKR